MSEELFTSVDADIERDRWGRPLILNPRTGEVQAYTRISTFASTLDDGGGLAGWKAKHVALGLAARRELCDLIVGMQYGDPGLNEVVERAADAALLNEKADYGTAIHRFTEPDKGHLTPDHMRDDVDSYHRAIQDAGLMVAATEQFVVNHELGVAGTLDHLYIDKQGRQLVGDKKTGTLRALSTAIQLACYAGAELYDIKTGETSPLGADLSTAILIHIPRGEGITKVYEVNIGAAGLLCELAREVRAARSGSKSLVKAWGE
jgi:hypothetical protein